jgi:hypothetical protein
MGLMNALLKEQKMKGCSAAKHRTDCETYLGERKGTYEFRCKRYRAVADRMEQLGLAAYDKIVDIGAGRCEFGLYLRERFSSLNLYYMPFDGSLDGVNLEKWVPPIEADFYIAIEFLEHLSYPWRLMTDMRRMSRKGVVLTTPNPKCTDVLGMDRTHKTPISMQQLSFHGFRCRAQRMFTETKMDTIIAWDYGRQDGSVSTLPRKR